MPPAEEPPAARISIIDSLGVEIVGVMSPVSICMLLVVLILTSLSSPASTSSPPPVTAATLIYVESASDSPSHKLFGAVLDAAAFVALIAVATFLLVLLYYYNFTSFLKNYLRFSVFFVLASMGGSIMASLLQHFSIPLDAPTSIILLLNFSILGVLSVFSPAVPIFLRQSYMVAVAVIVAVWFARLPEWTTWVLLIALAIYDLVAVLCPRGPLRILVELASDRDDELPALVYEARPTVSSPPVSEPVSSPLSSIGSVELQPVTATEPSNSNSVDEEERSPLVSSPPVVRDNLNNVNHVQIRESNNSNHAVVEMETGESETLPLVEREGQRPPPDSNSEFEVFDSTRGIRLGLGDFVFYSVLVGRAAMYDLMTVYACYLAIISGLGCTLILLSVFRHALPALPISITLGVIFYFLTRLLMEPFVVGASTNLVMF
ncbi:presenilin-like protein [Carex littledalei]|uniref:Presenilin n=1 Tax=Carex littledalei TaxID=544730 RepID=A0A833QSX1_9POAL|nr:presenilin-like protein [Carex littledalei]